MQTIRLIDLIDEIQNNKNIRKHSVLRVIRAIPKVVTKMLLDKKEIRFTPFLKLGFRTAKDRIIKSSITKEMLHIPQHLRFKVTFYDKFKTFLNNGD